MSRLLAGALALSVLVASACAPTPAPAPPPPPPPAASYPIVGGASMDPRVTMFLNLSKSADHRILVSALRGAGTAQALSSAGAYTLFAPSDSAFRRLPNGTMEALLHPRSRFELTSLVNYHVVPGARTRSRIMADIQAGGGSTAYRTQQGQMLRARMEAGRVVLTDMNGRRSYVTQADITHANGVFHVVDAVLLPEQS
ncbi:MAG TPA: fasciclin domain-containing protein [Allosphingosinicella sp.]|jgi:uncharacterized surface protein with fasciclin (FAS1) repeats